MSLVDRKEQRREGVTGDMTSTEVVRVLSFNVLAQVRS